MNYSFLLALCFLPLAIIIIITKLSLLISSTISESKYVKNESRKPHGKFVDNPYADVDKKKEADRDF
jgi:hypothetical protein